VYLAHAPARKPAYDCPEGDGEAPDGVAVGDADEDGEAVCEGDDEEDGVPVAEGEDDAPDDAEGEGDGLLLAGRVTT
jgi:hypothetical protein